MDFLELPDEAYQWLTPKINDLLNAIKKPHISKKRTTIIKLAFAKANGKPLREVFSAGDTCSESIWYRKWKLEPEVFEAYEACCERALAWNDEYTAAIEAGYRLRRKQLVAKYATDAPGALADIMLNDEQKGADRISAANALMGWADPDAAEKVAPSSPASSITQNFDFTKLSDEELDVQLAKLTNKAPSNSPHND